MVVVAAGVVVEDDVAALVGSAYEGTGVGHHQTFGAEEAVDGRGSSGGKVGSVGVAPQIVLTGGDEDVARGQQGSSRSVEIDTIQAESHSMLSRKRLGNRRTSFRSKPSICMGATVVFCSFPA